MTVKYILYFAMYIAHFSAHIFEGKIRMHLIHGYSDYIILCISAQKCGCTLYKGVYLHTAEHSALVMLFSDVKVPAWLLA